jgi:hypothetical protein
MAAGSQFIYTRESAPPQAAQGAVPGGNDARRVFTGRTLRVNTNTVNMTVGGIGGSLVHGHWIYFRFIAGNGSA